MNVKTGELNRLPVCDSDGDMTATNKASLPALSVVIPCLNMAQSLPATIKSLAEGASVFRLEILVVDGGSTDESVQTAEELGAGVMNAPRGRGNQMAAGAEAASGDWIIFLHADTTLEPGWAREVADYIALPEHSETAGYFQYSLDDPNHPQAARLKRIVAWRARVFGLPYGDQGLLVPSGFLKRLGGVSRIPLMEDVDLVRRVGRKRLRPLHTHAYTSAVRYHDIGYYHRSTRNLLCLLLYYLGVSPHVIKRIYG